MKKHPNAEKNPEIQAMLEANRRADLDDSDERVAEAIRLLGIASRKYKANGSKSSGAICDSAITRLEEIPGAKK